MAIILHIETSTEVCSAALSRNGHIIDFRESSEGLNHSKILTVFIEEMCKFNRLAADKIDAVSVSKGPGSYTGLRIGVSVAKGLCYSLRIPLLAVGSLESLASHTAQNIDDYFIGEESSDKVVLCPMIDARRMEVYYAMFDCSGNQIEPVSAKIIDNSSFNERLKSQKVLFFGNGAAKCRNVIVNPNACFVGPEFTSARFMIAVAEDRFQRGLFENVAYFEPLYFKDFIATTPKNRVFK